MDFLSLGDPDGVGGLRHLRALADRYGDAGLTVLGVHVPAYEFERSPEAVRRELWRLGVPWPVALDRTYEVFRAWNAGDLPCRALVDHQGYLRTLGRGAETLGELESTIRLLLSEGRPEQPLPPTLEPDPAVGRPGAPRWYPTPEIRFGTRGLALAEPGEPEPEERTFETPPDLRAEGRPYLEGTFGSAADHLELRSDEGQVAIVFEGADVLAVLGTPPDSGDEIPELEIRVDGATPGPRFAGADLDLDEAGEAGPTTRALVERGGVYELVCGLPFGVHHLEIRIRGRGVQLHGLRFGTRDVPDVP
ncbi:MAG: hypothetical protein R3B81_00730 [bacterium]